MSARVVFRVVASWWRSLALGACTMAPRYEQPAAPVQAEYEHTDAHGRRR